MSSYGRAEDNVHEVLDSAGIEHDSDLTNQILDAVYDVAYLAGQNSKKRPARYPQGVHQEVLHNTISEILAERAWALENRGGPMSSPLEWISLIAEELGEAAEHANHMHFNVDEGWRRRQFEVELAQIAQLAVSAIVWSRTSPKTEPIWKVSDDA